MNSQELISSFSSLPLRETWSRLGSHNRKLPQAEEQANRKSKESFARAKAVCARAGVLLRALVQLLPHLQSWLEKGAPTEDPPLCAATKASTWNWCRSRMPSQNLNLVTISSKPHGCSETSTITCSALPLLGCTRIKGPTLLWELKPYK